NEFESEREGKTNQPRNKADEHGDLFYRGSILKNLSHSSITDDESRSSHSFHTRNQKEDCAVYIPDKAVTKSEPSDKAISGDAQPTQVITELRRSYTSKLEESEKRKQELLAQLAAEEQHGHELTKIVRELLPTPKKTANLQRRPRHRRRSNDRSRMSKRLIEEAEQYFQDFSLVQAMTETPVAFPKVALPAVADGVVLPWLQWETTNDLQTSSPCKTKAQVTT
ncbi:hypothetical protein ACJX0J_028217, partial [Zea mays]